MDSAADETNRLDARWGGDDGDGIGRLSVTVRSGGFGGLGRAWFDRERVLDFAQAVGRYPLPQGDPAQLSGGYGRSTEYDEYVGIVVEPLGNRGQVDVRVHVVNDALSGDHLPEGRYETRLHLVTTYENLSDFSRDLRALVEGEISVASLGGERIA